MAKSIAATKIIRNNDILQSRNNKKGQRNFRKTTNKILV